MQRFVRLRPVAANRRDRGRAWPPPVNRIVRYFRQHASSVEIHAALPRLCEAHGTVVVHKADPFLGSSSGPPSLLQLCRGALTKWRHFGGDFAALTPKEAALLFLTAFGAGEPGRSPVRSEHCLPLVAIAASERDGRAVLRRNASLVWSGLSSAAPLLDRSSRWVIATSFFSGLVTQAIVDRLQPPGFVHLNQWLSVVVAGDLHAGDLWHRAFEVTARVLSHTGENAPNDDGDSVHSILHKVRDIATQAPPGVPQAVRRRAVDNLSALIPRRPEGQPGGPSKRHRVSSYTVMTMPLEGRTRSLSWDRCLRVIATAEEAEVPDVACHDALHALRQQRPPLWLRYTRAVGALMVRRRESIPSSRRASPPAAPTAASRGGSSAAPGIGWRRALSTLSDATQLYRHDDQRVVAAARQLVDSTRLAPLRGTGVWRAAFTAASVLFDAPQPMASSIQCTTPPPLFCWLWQNGMLEAARCKGLDDSRLRHLLVATLQRLRPHPVDVAWSLDVTPPDDGTRRVVMQLAVATRQLAHAARPSADGSGLRTAPPEVQELANILLTLKTAGGGWMAGLAIARATPAVVFPSSQMALISHVCKHAPAVALDRPAWCHALLLCAALRSNAAATSLGGFVLQPAMRTLWTAIRVLAGQAPVLRSAISPSVLVDETATSLVVNASNEYALTRFVETRCLPCDGGASRWWLRDECESALARLPRRSLLEDLRSSDLPSLSLADWASVMRSRTYARQPLAEQLAVLDAFISGACHPVGPDVVSVNGAPEPVATALQPTDVSFVVDLIALLCHATETLDEVLSRVAWLASAGRLPLALDNDPSVHDVHPPSALGARWARSRSLLMQHLVAAARGGCDTASVISASLLLFERPSRLRPSTAAYCGAVLSRAVTR